MNTAVTLTFRNLSRSWALDASARHIGQRLKALHHRMTACHIVFEGNGGAPATVGRYQVKIHLSLPGAQIHAESTDAPADDPLHSAYENARRQIEKLKQLQGPM